MRVVLVLVAGGDQFATCLHKLYPPPFDNELWLHEFSSGWDPATFLLPNYPANLSILSISQVTEQSMFLLPFSDMFVGKGRLG